MTVSKEYLAEGGEAKQPEGKFLVRIALECAACATSATRVCFDASIRERKQTALKGDINQTKVTVRGKRNRSRRILFVRFLLRYINGL